MGSYIGKFKYEIYIIIFSFFALIVHIHLASTLNLGNDEAHYYVWSLKPSLGYLDDAPLVGWVIYAFTWLLGKSQLSVRFGALVFSFLDGFLIYYLSYILFRNKRAAFFSFLFFLSAVIFGTVLSVMILPDAPLLFFTLLFFIFFYKALTIDIEEKGTQERGQISNLSPFLEEAGEEKGTDIFYFEEINKSVPFSFLLRRGVGRRPTGRFFWLLAGISLGFAFLSKYTAALIPPAVLLYLLVSKRNRRFLKTVYPYMALASALIVFSPVIYWNFTHNFISFKFQLSHGFSHPKPGFPLLAAGWFGQVLVITPFIYIFLIGAFIYAIIKGTYLFYFRNEKQNLSSGSTEINKSVPFITLLLSRGVGRRPAGRLTDGWFDYREPLLFSICLSLPILLFFVVNGYSHRILVHWPDIGYLAAFPIMGYAADLLTRKSSSRILKYCVYFAVFSGFFLSYILYNQIYYNSIPVGKIIRYIDREKRLKKGGVFSLIPHIPGKPSTADITNDLFGWRHSAKYIGIVYKGYKAVYHPLFILTHHYAIADELVYYGGYKPAVNIYNISGFLNQYDLWQNLDKINGENALFIMDNKYMLNPVKKYWPYFKSIKKIGRLDIYVKFRPLRTYYLYLMKDFDAKKAIKRLNAESRMY